ncbi:MAG: peptide chain release factor-like protein [Desulfobacterium sp.]|nr:peptide chain release factor-like protein [Desulfobacterium sp.]
MKGDKFLGPGIEKIKALEIRIKALGIKKDEIEEKFVKGSGRGGQKVNKTSVAVFLRHIPTGITVKCGSERSQHLNRFLALRRLIDKIEAGITGKKDKEPDIQRRIKQKQKRKKRSSKKHGLKPTSPDGHNEP